jgi:uncharacterized membrane protein
MTAAALAPSRLRRIAPLIAPLLLTIAATATLTLLGYAMRGADTGGGGDYHTPAWALWIHLGTVIPAVPLGAWVLWGPKGTRGHKTAGRVWALMMLVTAIDSFWIRGLTGGIGPIHIFSVLTLVSIPLAIWHVRRGRIAAHRRAMIGVYIGLFVAGGFAMMPGRMLSGLFFG